MDLVERLVRTIYGMDLPEPVKPPEPVDVVITVTIRTDDPFASEHLKHLLEAEGYDADIMVSEAS